MASTIDKPGKYKVTVTMSTGYDGCEVAFSPSDSKITVGHLGNNVYEIDVQEGANGTIQVLVNDNPCDDYKIVVNTGQACECANLSVTANPNISNAGGNVTVATYESSVAGCSFDVKVFSVSPNNGWLKNVSASNGAITGTAEPNLSGSRDAIITITGVTSDGKQCTDWDTIKVTQQESGCKCGDLTIPDASYTWKATDKSNNQHQFTITSAACITNITKNSLDYFNATFGNGVVTVAPKNENPGDQPHIEDLIISYTAGTKSCSSTIKLTQSAASCKASTCYTVNGDAVNKSTVQYNDEEAYVEWEYTETVITPPSCVPVVSEIKSSGTTVGLLKVGTCDTEEEGDFMWNGHKDCNDDSSDVKIHWLVTKTQKPGCGCSCSSNLHVRGITNTKTTEIEYEKQTTAYKVGSYSIDQDCTQVMSIDSVRVTEGDDWLTITSGNRTPILATWTENESTEDTRTATITVKAKLNGEICQDSQTIQVIQAKNTSCQCGYITITPNIEITNAGGDVTAATYESSAAGCSFTITNVNVTSTDNWLTYKNSSDGNIVCTAQPNNGGERSATIAITGKTSDEKICTNWGSVTAKQKDAGCSCGIMTVSVNNKRDWDANENGASVAQTINYTIDEGKEGCVTNIRVSAQGDDKDKFVIKYNNNEVTEFPFIVNGNKTVEVYPKGENQEEEHNYTITIQYTYDTVNGITDCTPAPIIFVQNSPACNCTKLLDSPCMLTTVPLAGKEYYIGSGETHNCGVFEISPRTTDNIEGYRVDNETHPGISEFYITFANKTGSQNDYNSDIDINFIYNGDSENENKCSKSITIVQTPNYLSCDRLGELLNSINSEKELEHVEGSVRNTQILAFLNPHKKTFDLFNEKNLLLYEVTEGGDWLSYDRYDGSGIQFSSIYVNIQPGTDCQLRNAKFKISLNKEIAKDYGLCNCEVFEKEITITEIEDDCFDTDRNDKISSEIESGNVNLDRVCPSCLDRIEIKCGNVTISQKDSPFVDENYVALPGDYSWFRVCPYLSDRGDGFASVLLYYKCSKNSTGMDRSAIFSYRVCFRSGKVCVTNFNTIQSKAEPIICENAYSYNYDEGGPFYNIYSADTNTTSMHKNILSYKGYEKWPMASYNRTKKYAIPNIVLSGVVETAAANWVQFVPSDRPGQEVSFTYNVDENKTPIEAISTNYDGSTRGRGADIRLFLIGSDNLPIKDGDGNVCPGLSFPIYQEGFSGYCPTCNSVEKLDSTKDYIIMDYDGYGEPHQQYNDSSSVPLMVPGYTGNGRNEIDLFECELNIEDTTYPPETNDSNTIHIRCFDLIPETDNEYVVENSLRAVLKNNETNKYVIKGILKENDSQTGSQISVSIKFYLGKRDFLNNTTKRCDNTLTLGYLKLLPNTTT